MAIITFTTDFGNMDFYSAAMKAWVLRGDPGATLVDISNEVAPFNILQAAFLVQNVFYEFPEGSIHVIGVDPIGGEESEMVAMRMEEHFFLAPDNGILSLISEGKVCESRRIIYKEGMIPSGPFLAKSVLAIVAGTLSAGQSFEDLGPVNQLSPGLWGSPPLTGDTLRGSIVHLDHFGNAITNLHIDYFHRVRKERSFRLYLRKLNLKRISKTYGDVGKGEALALFGESGMLEVAIREGSAKRLLGLNEQDMFTIEFH